MGLHDTRNPPSSNGKRGGTATPPGASSDKKRREHANSNSIPPNFNHWPEHNTVISGERLTAPGTPTIKSRRRVVNAPLGSNSVCSQAPAVQAASSSSRASHARGSERKRLVHEGSSNYDFGVLTDAASGSKRRRKLNDFLTTGDRHEASGMGCAPSTTSPNTVRHTSDNLKLQRSSKARRARAPPNSDLRLKKRRKRTIDTEATGNSIETSSNSANSPPTRSLSGSFGSSTETNNTNTSSTEGNSNNNTNHSTAKPWKGSIQGATWNSNGLICGNPGLRQKKFQTLSSLLGPREVVVVTETHSSKTQASAAQSRVNTLSISTFWSHGGLTRYGPVRPPHLEGTSDSESEIPGNEDNDEEDTDSDVTGVIHRREPRRKHGVAIFVKNEFLNQFKSIHFNDKIKKGRICRLELEDEQNRVLHIYGCYLSATGGSGARTREFRLLQQVMRKDVHNIVMGDFNFTTFDNDRYSHEAPIGWRKADKEAKLWHDLFTNNDQLQEIYQPLSTYHHTSRMSRIDRVYTSLGQHDLTLYNIECRTLHNVSTSDHKPVAFNLALKRKGGGRLKFPPWVWTHPNFPGAFKKAWEEVDGLLTPDVFEQLNKLTFCLAAAANEVANAHHEHPPKSAREHLNITAAYARAWMRKDFDKMAKLSRTYNELAQLNNNYSEAAEAKLNDLIRKWHREALNDDLQRIDEISACMDSELASGKAKRQLLQRLKANMPRSPSCLNAVWDPVHSCIVEDPAEVAATVTSHWQRVFNETPIDTVLMEKWLSDFHVNINANTKQLTPTLNQVKEVIKASGPSSPGPDGIPFEAYKAVVDIAGLILHRVARNLIDLDVADLPAHFNSALLVLLPKKPNFVDPDRGDIFSPENMRPLSIVNCFNRIIANAYRVALEPFTKNLISNMQRGFMKNRLITENIVDIDFASMKVRMKGERGAIVLFDFKAAFPSINHNYMWATLSKLGIPNNIIRAYQRLYINNNHTINIGGRSFASVTVKSGVRQGCPISPLLFILCLEPLLRKLEAAFPTATFRAFADDIGGVFNDIEAVWPTLVDVFLQFGRISNLVVHPTKTIILPLWKVNIDFLKKSPWISQSPWAEVSIGWHAKYLGVLLGLGATAGMNFQPCLDKLKKAVSFWQQIPASFFVKVRIWNVFLVA